MTALPTTKQQTHQVNIAKLHHVHHSNQVPMPTIGVIIPTLNEAKNLPHVLPLIPKWVNEVIIVDGRSTDNTIEVAKQYWPDAKIVLETGHGKGIALRTGFNAAKSDILITLDADGSADPAEISLFVGALLAGADFVKGSRFLQGGGTEDMEWYRRLGNFGLLMLVRTLFGGKYSDLCYGYNAFWRSALPSLDLDADGFEIETLMNIRALRVDLNIAEVPSFEANRIHGTSNLNTFRDGFRVLRTILVEFAKKFKAAHPQSNPKVIREKLAFSFTNVMASSYQFSADDLCPTCAQPWSLHKE